MSASRSLAPQRRQRQVVAGVLRVWSCSSVLGGAKCNGRHADLVNEIKDRSANAPSTNQGVGSSNLSGRANKSKCYAASRLKKICM